MKKLLLATIAAASLLGNANIHATNKTTNTVPKKAYVYPTVKTGIGASLILLSSLPSYPYANSLQRRSLNLRESLLFLGIGLELFRTGGKDIITLRQKDKKPLSKYEHLFLKFFYPPIS